MWFQDKNFKSSLLDNREVNEDFEVLKNVKIETKTFIKDYFLTAETFNRHKVIKFEYDSSDSLIDFEVKPSLDKSCFVEIAIISTKEKIVLIGE